MMEIMLDELKQYDLMRINYTELKANNYYLGYNYKKSIELFYCGCDYFDDDSIDLLWSDEYDKIYEFIFIKKITDTITDTIINTFYYVCNNLKKNDQSIEMISVYLNKYICLKITNCRHKKEKTNIVIYYSNNLHIDFPIKITEFDNFIELSKKINIFMNKKNNIYDNTITFYY